MKKGNTYSSFTAFKEALSQWFLDHKDAKWLDYCATREKPAGIPFIAFKTAEIPDMNVKISLHADTTREALGRLLKAEINDFIIAPPSDGNKFWRLDLKKDFNLKNDTERNGLYAYVKNEPKKKIHYSQ